MIAIPLVNDIIVFVASAYVAALFPTIALCIGPSHSSQTSLLIAPNTHMACFFLLVYAPSVENASLKTRLSEPLLFRGLPKALTA